MEATRPKLLHLFAGTHGTLANMGDTVGWEVEEVDIAVDGTDLSDPHVQRSYEARVGSGEFHAILLGTPCSSFSVALGADNHSAVILRSWRYPDGLPNLEGQNLQKLKTANKLVRFTARIAATQIGLRGEVIIENPRPRGQTSSRRHTGQNARTYLPCGPPAGC